MNQIEGELPGISEKELLLCEFENLEICLPSESLTLEVGAFCISFTVITFHN